MNGISGNGIFSAYPEMTCAYHGNFNPMVFALDRGSPKMPLANVREAFRKYFDRGFDIRRNPACWPNNIHVCTRSSRCPHTARNAEDWGCLYVPFRDLGENDRVGLKAGSISIDTSENEELVVWLLGGRRCDGRPFGSLGYVSTHRVYWEGNGII